MEKKVKNASFIIFTTDSNLQQVCSSGLYYSKIFCRRHTSTEPSSVQSDLLEEVLPQWRKYSYWVKNVQEVSCLWDRDSLSRASRTF